MKTKMSYAIGDVVEFIGDYHRYKKGDIHHITQTELNLNGNFVHYFTDIGGWFKNEDFKLLIEADAESLAYVVKAINDDDIDKE